MSTSLEHQDRVRTLIEGCEHMTVASVDADGRPWASPVFYAYDHDRVLYWVSAKNARHSVNVRIRPEIGIVIYTTGDRTDALYAEAEARELADPDELAPAIKVMQSRPQPERFKIKDAADVTGDAVWRIYRAVPNRLYLREEATESGQTITRRLPVDL